MDKRILTNENLIQTCHKYSESEFDVKRRKDNRDPNLFLTCNSI